jgi:anti-sigma28 factor (negative regulator of flagellin synthesis)
MRLHLDSGVAATGITGGAEAGQTESVSGARGGSGGSGTLSAGGDSIQLSGPSAILNRLSADRAGRIQQLTSLVQSGSYNVSSSQISRALVDHAVSGGQ